MLLIFKKCSILNCNDATLKFYNIFKKSAYALIIIIILPMQIKYHLLNIAIELNIL